MDHKNSETFLHGCSISMLRQTRAFRNAATRRGVHEASPVIEGPPLVNGLTMAPKRGRPPSSAAAKPACGRGRWTPAPELVDSLSCRMLGNSWPSLVKMDKKWGDFHRHVRSRWRELWETHSVGHSCVRSRFMDARFDRGSQRQEPL